MTRGTVFFDCDSTLVRVEGIDELATRAGAGDAIARLTNEAMDGNVPLEEVYGRRLEIVRPGRDDLDWLGGRYVETLVEGAVEVVAACQAARFDVHVVSGGLLGPVRVLAERLGVPRSAVHAVPVELDESGAYQGFDPACPLARSGGKAIVIGEVLSRSAGVSVMIGDGGTDMELVGVCDRVIGFGGVAAREAVRRAAHAFVEGPTLYPVLVHVLDDHTLEALEAGPHAETVRRARRAAIPPSRG